MISSNRALGSLNIDFEKFDKLNPDGTYAIGDNVFTLDEKKKHLDWTKEEIHSVDEQLSIYNALPIKCRGAECSFADTCPLVKLNKVERFIDKECPIEIIDAFRHFAGYVNHLELHPHEYSDLMLINDLVRLQVLMKRCDLMARSESPAEYFVEGIDIKTTLGHSAKKVNTLYTLQKELRSDIAVLYKSLVASRAAKIDADAKKKPENKPSMQLLKETLAAAIALKAKEKAEMPKE